MPIFLGEEDRDLRDHLSTFTPRFSRPLFQKEFDELNYITGEDCCALQAQADFAGGVSML